MTTAGGRIQLIRIFDGPDRDGTQWFTFVYLDETTHHEAVFIRDKEGLLRETDASLIGLSTEDGCVHIRRFAER